MKFSQSSPPNGTVRDWLDQRATDDGVAFVFPETGAALTWSALAEDANQFAVNLTSRGAQKSESIAIISPNSQEGVTALYGALYGGFRATMINLAAGRDAITYALGHSKARFAYVHPRAEEIFEIKNVC